jgi:hypothetical protein
MSEFLTAMSILTILAAPIAAWIYLGDIFHDGILDANYPNVANGDWRTGWRRDLYLAGRRRGEFLIAREQERERLTRERKGT